MGKKQRRKQHHRTTQQAHVQPAHVTATDTPVTSEEPHIQQKPAATPRPRAATPSWAEFRERYRYVNAELKRIGILAGSFLVVLLILAAVLG